MSWTLVLQIIVLALVACLAGAFLAEAFAPKPGRIGKMGPPGPCGPPGPMGARGLTGPGCSGPCCNERSSL